MIAQTNQNASLSVFELAAAVPHQDLVASLYKRAGVIYHENYYKIIDGQLMTRPMSTHVSSRLIDNSNVIIASLTVRGMGDVVLALIHGYTVEVCGEFYRMDQMGVWQLDISI